MHQKLKINLENIPQVVGSHIVPKGVANVMNLKRVNSDLTSCSPLQCSSTCIMLMDISYTFPTLIIRFSFTKELEKIMMSPMIDEKSTNHPERCDPREYIVKKPEEPRQDLITKWRIEPHPVYTDQTIRGKRRSAAINV